MKTFTKEKFLSIFIFLLITLLFSSGFFVYASALNFEQIQTEINLQNATDIAVMNGNTYVLKENTIYNITESETFSLNSQGAGNGELFNPKCLTSLNDNRVAVADELCVQIFSSNLVFLENNRFDLIYNSTSNSYLKLGKVVDISADFNGNIYGLDVTNNIIVKLSPNQNYFSVFASCNFEVNESCKIAISPSGNNIAVLNLTNNKIDVNGNSFECVAENVMFDCADNLYLTSSTAGNTTLTKTDLSLNEIATKNIGLTAVSSCLEVESGNIYFLKDGIYKVDCKGFTVSSTNIQPPFLIETAEPSEREFKVLSFSNTKNLYISPFGYSSYTIIPENTKFLILTENISTNSNLYYVCTYFNNQEYLGYIEKENGTEIFTTEIGQTYFAICKNVPVLSSPISNASSFATLNTDFAVKVVGKSSFNTNNEYYVVQKNGKIGYVQTNFLSAQKDANILITNTNNINSNQNQFVALVIIIFCILMATITIIAMVYYKDKKNKNIK